MHFDRAKEIFHASNTIDVSYNGTSIWITGLDRSKQTAQIKMPSTSNNIIEVPVTDLLEG